MKPTPELVEIIEREIGPALLDPSVPPYRKLTVAAIAAIEAIPVPDHSELVARLRIGHDPYAQAYLVELCEEAADALEGKSNG